ncbi:MAG: chorismate mutase [Lachnospirales bacterium]
MDRLLSVRGATTVEVNIKEKILDVTREMMLEIFKENFIEIDNIVSIIFTTTKDLDKVYPAVAVREIGVLNASLMCVQEQYVENSLEKCIRVMVQFYGDKKQSEVSHIYLRGAENLRPDLKRG